MYLSLVDHYQNITKCVGDVSVGDLVITSVFLASCENVKKLMYRVICPILTAFLQFLAYYQNMDILGLLIF